MSAIISLVLLAAAGWGYHSQAAKDDGLAGHGVTTSAVIGQVVHGTLAASTSGGTSAATYAVAAFVADGTLKHARVALPSCSGTACAQGYADGQRLTITYDSRDPASAVAGRPVTPALHLNAGIVFAALLGLFFLGAAVVNFLEPGYWGRARRDRPSPGLGRGGHGGG
jgi:hypothetical protein